MKDMWHVCLHYPVHHKIYYYSITAWCTKNGLKSFFSMVVAPAKEPFLFRSQIPPWLWSHLLLAGPCIRGSYFWFLVMLPLPIVSLGLVIAFCFCWSWGCLTVPVCLLLHALSTPYIKFPLFEIARVVLFFSDWSLNDMPPLKICSMFYLFYGKIVFRKPQVGSLSHPILPTYFCAI